MIKDMEIPDPFATFVAKKYANFKGMRYDFFSGEWDMECAACNEPLSAPNKKTMTKIRLYHTRNECLGGYLMARTWEYSLSAKEEAICVEIGYQRQKPYFGDPSKNINYAEGDLWEMWQHVVCAGSELAFARMLGKTEFVPHFNKWKTELDIPGMGEIRYSFNPKGGLRFTKRDNPDLKYVLMIDGMAIKNRTGRNEDRRSTPYKAIGWMYGHECIQDIYLSKYNNTTWVVPYDKLKAMPN